MTLSLRGIRVLLVDDEAEFVQTLAQRLELRGLVPTVANSGVAGLALLGTGQFDIMLLDMQLPGMSGIDVLKAMQTEKNAQPAPSGQHVQAVASAQLAQSVHSGSAAIPVIMLTGNATGPEHGAKVGADPKSGTGAYACLTKPIDLGVLLETMEKALAHVTVEIR